MRKASLFEKGEEMFFIFSNIFTQSKRATSAHMQKGHAYSVLLTTGGNTQNGKSRMQSLFEILERLLNNNTKNY